MSIQEARCHSLMKIWLFDCMKMTNQRYSNIAPPEDATRFLACYNGVYIIPIERPITVIESGGWTLQSAPFIYIDDQKIY